MGCPASAQRPDIAIDTSEESADIGRAVHEALAWLIEEDAHRPVSGANEADLFGISAKHGAPDGDVKMLAWAGWKMWKQIDESLTDIQLEQSMEVTSKRGYRLTGTADVMALMSGRPDTLVIFDWKSGRRESNPFDQLKGYALMGSMLRPAISRAIVSVGWLRTGMIESHSFSLDDMTAFDIELSEALTSSSPVFKPSAETCLFCPRKADCPGRRQIVASAGLDMAAASGESANAMTPAALGALWPRSRMLKKVLEDYEDAVRIAVMDAGGRMDCDCGTLAFVESSRSTIFWNQDVLAPYIAPEVMQRLRPTIGNGQLKDAIGESAPNGLKGKRIKEALGALDAAGCIEEKTFPKLQFTAKS